MACRELDAALGLTETANDYIHESRTGRMGSKRESPITATSSPYVITHSSCSTISEIAKVQCFDRATSTALSGGGRLWSQSWSDTRRRESGCCSGPMLPLLSPRCTSTWTSRPSFSASDSETITGEPFAGNDYVADIVKKHPDEFIGFGSEDTWKGALAVRKAEWCMKELGLKGFKLYPSGQAFFPNDPKFYPLWDKCRKTMLNVLVQVGLRRNTGASGYENPGSFRRWLTGQPSYAIQACGRSTVIVGHIPEPDLLPATIQTSK